MGPSVLVVDDEESIRAALQLLLSERGFAVHTAASGEEGLERARQAVPDAAVLDLNLPGMDGIETLDRLRQLEPHLPVIIITAFASIPSAVEAMRRGAVDYVAKPFRNDDLLLRLERALEAVQLRREVARLRDQLGEADPFHRLVGRGAAMAAVVERAGRVAGRQVTVLVTGESGTGKEVLARALHQASPRRDRPFVAVNCGAIPAELVENELFGHERGAFTGAGARQTGYFEQADGGTLFLDEIGELPLAAQPKLLRALEEGRIARLGGQGETILDVRLVAATNRQLEEEVAAGRFRDDLYYRLNVFAVCLPPLRERVEDVPLLVEHLAQKHAPLMEVAWAGATPAAMQCLQTYGWPGNVRELENAVQSALLLADGRPVDLGDLPPRVRGGEVAPADGSPVVPPSLAEMVAQLERRAIRQALQAEDHNHTRTARRLGISRQGLLNKIQAYGLESP
ncbi:MAG: sigma-54 dependent transcriptional regulator [Gemmatimonadota bacterium]